MFLVLMFLHTVVDRKCKTVKKKKIGEGLLLSAQSRSGHHHFQRVESTAEQETS